MNKKQIIKTLRFPKWHIYCEIVFFMLGMLSLFSAAKNPIFKILFPRWMLLLNIALFLIGMVWLLFLAHKINLIEKALLVK